MWWTSNGERVLEGAEASLFRECLARLVDDLFTLRDEDFAVGVTVFDRLTRAQKVAMLAVVGEALLRRDIPMPELTAVSEATVAAVFAYLRGDVGFELDEPDFGQYWRAKIVRACEECGAEEFPPPDCEDPEEWDLWIGFLEDQIFWDADWDSEMGSLDCGPDEAEAGRRLFGITENYYTEIAPDPTEEDVERLHAEIQRLCSP